MQHPPRLQRGFSMVEVAVSLAVLGILMASAMPSLGNWMANARIRNTAESMQEGLQKARTEAVRRNQNVTFWLMTSTNPKALSSDCTKSATGGSWVVSLTDPTSKCDVAPSPNTAPQTVALRPIGDGGDGVTVSAKRRDGSTDATSITFNAFGQVTSSEAIGIISVNDGTTGNEHRKYRVMVSSGGRSILCDEAVTNTSDPRICPAS